VVLGVAYSSDIPTTRRALTAALDSIPEVLDDPASVVVLVRFGKSAIEWQVGAWCKRSDVGTVQQAVMQTVQDQLTRAGIQLVPML
jgi:small-conductance mechanosensitive channel